MLAKPVDQRIGNISHGHGDAACHASLARTAVGTRGQGFYRLIEIGVRHDNQVILGSPRSLHALAVLGANFVDVLGDGRGTDE